ncbi:hypothetical protein J8L85_13475 [Maribacter sp. MMG018]|uniref:hypothetical protein n=1 Tax=Maribacter sp. MMG018 TaxID=2822688 RepID=UPI001B358C87|nr:hypothetical protein [Maribacter sp. MMG018]MBQ4915459.1 hypothetical protein [Maribacter sp. MMG018]
MGSSRTIMVVMGMLFFIMAPRVNAQFFKKLKQQAEEKLTEKANKEVDDIFTENKGTTKKEEGAKELGTVKTDENKVVPPTTVPQSTTTFNESDYLVYKSPDPAFHDVYVQKFKGLPRFGSCNFYTMPNNPKIPVSTPEVNEKRVKMKMGYNAFLLLARMHTLKNHFKVMDRTALTPISKPLVEDEVKSNMAQGYLMNFAFLMGTDALKKEYFMNDRNGDGNAPIVSKWGGQYADDFTENEKYVAFVEKYLDKILQWTQTFFEDATEDFQFVVPLEFKGSYDFDKNGFWVQLPTKRRSSYSMDFGSTRDNYFFEFLPKTPYGQQIFNKTQQVEHINAEVLFKMDPAAAEALINDKTKNPQMVVKVKVVYEGFRPENPTIYAPKYTYHLLDPIMELYSDAGLTKKIGEINLQNLTYKGTD